MRRQACTCARARVRQLWRCTLEAHVEVALPRRDVQRRLTRAAKRGACREARVERLLERVHLPRLAPFLRQVPRLLHAGVAGVGARRCLRHMRLWRGWAAHRAARALQPTRAQRRGPARPLQQLRAHAVRVQEKLLLGKQRSRWHGGGCKGTSPSVSTSEQCSQRPHALRQHARPHAPPGSQLWPASSC